VARTSIEWTERPRPDGSLMPGYTFNAWWGCREAGPECDRCYARTFAHRLGLELWGANAPRRPASEAYWREPEKWNRKAAAASEHHLVFCQSMSDVLENRRDLDPLRARLWDLIERTPSLIWLLLTKRPGRYATAVPDGWLAGGAPANVWAGTTCGTQHTADVNVALLQKSAFWARVRFLSMEPLLERTRLAGAVVPGGARIGWVIAGSETGHGARVTDRAWVRSLRDECQDAGAAFYWKQDAARGRPISRPELDGRQWLEFPAVAA
jgi:protein gp37